MRETAPSRSPFKQFFTLKNGVIALVVLFIASFELMPIQLYLFGLSYLVVPNGAIAWLIEL